jgi:adenylylsulfate kinase
MCELTIDEYNKMNNTDLPQDASAQLILELQNEIRNLYSPKVIWLTGLSGAGKSTIAKALMAELEEECVFAFNLDGDKLRSGLCNDLSYSDSDRKENIRRAAEMAKLLVADEFTVIVSLISPFEEDRFNARSIIGSKFIEVHIDCDIDECEKRDPKGLYKKYRDGLINNFTGFDSAYEKPENPDIYLNTKETSVADCVKLIFNKIQRGV